MVVGVESSFSEKLLSSKQAFQKYLGDQISCAGLAESVNCTVQKRKGRVIQSIYEIKTIIDDCRSHVTGLTDTFGKL